MKKKLLYIGNKNSNLGGAKTAIDSLSLLLDMEGYTIYSFSNKKNKGFRLLEMLFQTYKYRNQVDLVLIDTYSTQNFYYAVSVAKLCRAFKISYIPILHGGNLPQRLKKSPQLSKKLFKKC